MYGPSSAPGMRQHKSSLFKPRRQVLNRKDLWVPADSTDEEEGGEEGPAAPPAISSTHLPAILHIIPRLRLPNPMDSKVAAQELVAITNGTTPDEDELVGRTGLLEALALVLCKGTAEGRIHAATAFSNLVSHAEANKEHVGRMCEVLQGLVALCEAQGEREQGAAARAVLGLSSCRDAAIAVAKTPRALGALAGLVLTAKMATKEDVCKAFDNMAAHGGRLTGTLGHTDIVVQALKSSARSVNCSLRARLHSIQALHALSRCSQIREQLGRAKIVHDVCLPILSAEEGGKLMIDMQTLATLTAANLTSGPDDEAMYAHREHVRALVPALAASINHGEGTKLVRRSGHLLEGLSHFSGNDGLKKDIVESKALELSMDLIAMAHKQNQRAGFLELLLDIVLKLSFSELARDRMAQLDCVGMLRAHAIGPDQALRRTAGAALWCLGERVALGDVGQKYEQEGHIYMAYHKSDEAHVSQIAAALRHKGHTVLPDDLIAFHKGAAKRRCDSSLGDAVTGIRTAAAVCLCVSRTFGRNAFSRLLASVVADGSAPVIPILLDHVTPPRHLRALAPTLSCIDFADKGSFDLGMMELLEEVGETLAPAASSFATSGFGTALAAPTIAFTDMRATTSEADRLPAGGWQAAAASHGSSSPTGNSWGGYEPSFLQGWSEQDEASEFEWQQSVEALWDAPSDDDEDDDDDGEEGGGGGEGGGLGGAGAGDWGEDGGALPLDQVGAGIQSQVARTTAPLEARVRALEGKLRMRKAVLGALLSEEQAATVQQLAEATGTSVPLEGEVGGGEGELVL